MRMVMTYCAVPMRTVPVHFGNTPILTTMPLKGILAAGVLRSLRYLKDKLGKRFQRSNDVAVASD